MRNRTSERITTHQTIVVISTLLFTTALLTFTLRFYSIKKITQTNITPHNIEIESTKAQENNHLIKIIAPHTAIQDEYIIFKGEGLDNTWIWEFGESSNTHLREKTAIYTYSKPGIYEVLLSTENTRYSIRHQIKIYPKYIETNTADESSLMGLEIKERLQNIVNGKPFNNNYNFILKKYLNGDPNTRVIINNTKNNDFYSYCQGLRHAGKGITIIEDVTVEQKNKQNNFINELIITQHDKL